MAQEGPGGRRATPLLHRHRGGLDEVRLARVGLRLEAPSGHHRGRCVWIPLAARLTPANVSDNRVAPPLIEELAEEARFVLGDTHYNAPEVRAACVESGRFLVASGRGPYPHTDAGVEVRRIFHSLRHVAIENLRASISRPSSTPTGRCLPRDGSTPRASP